MSTIRKRKGKWFVEIRKKYFKPIRKTFEYKLDAEKYAREKQAEIDKGFLVSYEQAQSTKYLQLEVSEDTLFCNLQFHLISFWKLFPFCNVPTIHQI